MSRYLELWKRAVQALAIDWDRETLESEVMVALLKAKHATARPEERRRLERWTAEAVKYWTALPRSERPRAVNEW